MFGRNIFRSLSRNQKLFAILFTLSTLFYFLMFYNPGSENIESKVILSRFNQDLSRIGIKQYPVAQNYERRDWHDYEFMKLESEREGNGEKGAGFKFTNPEDIELDNKVGEEDGLHVLVSDKISVNRSVPDTRPEKCSHKKYLKNLPSTSVIVIFYNEWPSVLLRTLHSIYNRTPKELLKEIIMINDNSSKPELYEPLELYLKENFDERVQLIHLKERSGLIVTRMEGAKVATGEVLVFLDAHMEVNTNWLPPLLEPIAMSPTTVTTPTIEYIHRETFEYRYANISRITFDNLMWQQNMPLREIDSIQFPEPHQTPMMLGAGFATRRDFFMDLGQYDEGLKIWNGEQIEHSLKLHLCGGDLLEVPCSRVAHTFRSHHRNHELPGVDAAARNFKRVAEVWLGDYKDVMYRSNPKFKLIDAGDLTTAKLVKEKLNCKPFQYYLEKIAPEMYTRYFYQLHFPGYFAWGAVQSDAVPSLCFNYRSNEIGLNECENADAEKLHPDHHFDLTWHKILRNHDQQVCLQDNAAFSYCRYNDQQKWKYDIDTKQLKSLSKDQCLTIVIQDKRLSMNPCNSSDVTQKWTWTNVNQTALRNFDKIHFEDDVVVGLN